MVQSLPVDGSEDQSKVGFRDSNAAARARSASEGYHCSSPGNHRRHPQKQRPSGSQFTE